MNRDFIRRELAGSVAPIVQVALVRVTEECAELAKEAGKALRFGPLNRYPSTDPTNYAKMRAEFLDLLDAMVDAGALSRTVAVAALEHEIRNL